MPSDKLDEGPATAPTSAERIALGFEPAEDPDNGRGEVTAVLYKATDRIGDGGPLHET